MTALKNIPVENYDEWSSALRSFIKQRKKGVAENTVKTYVSNLKKIMGFNNVDTIAEVAVIPTAQIKNSLKGKGTPNSQASYLNAYISTLNLFTPEELKKGADYKKTNQLNNELGKKDQEEMDRNVMEGIDIPEDFDEKVDAYLKKHKGEAEGLLVALFAKAPPIRAHVLENCLLVRNSRQNTLAIKARTNSVFFVNSAEKRYELFVPNQLNKVKKFDFVSAYIEPDVREQLDAYVQKHKDNKYLFEKSGGGSLKTQAIDNKIKGAFEGAKIGYIGTQTLRRIFSTKSQNNPMLTKAMKELLASRMNHSASMDMAYGIKSFVLRTREGDATVQEIGKEIEKYVSKISKIADIQKLKKELDEIKYFVKHVS